MTQYWILAVVLIGFSVFVFISICRDARKNQRCFRRRNRPADTNHIQPTSADTIIDITPIPVTIQRPEPVLLPPAYTIIESRN